MRINISLLIAALLCFAGQGTAQTTNKITGRWEVNIEKTISSMTPEKRGKYDGMNPTKRSQIYESFKGRIFDIKEGSGVEISFTLRESLKEIRGSWAYDVSGDQLVLTINNNPNTYTIVWVNANEIKMVFSGKSPDGLFNLLVLERKN